MKEKRYIEDIKQQNTTKLKVMAAINWFGSLVCLVVFLIGAIIMAAGASRCVYLTIYLLALALMAFTFVDMVMYKKQKRKA